MLILKDCPKAYTKDQDKTVSPAETVARVKECLAPFGDGILAEIRRIDTGRLGIPVFLSEYGPKAREVVPTHRQMGKGASPDQAEASALMELVERYGWWSFFAEEGERLTWDGAEKRWPGQLIPLSQVNQSVNDDLSEEDVRAIMNLHGWNWQPVLHVASGEMRYCPIDWFKIINEYNGSSAGNRLEESVLQGACELVERHVCAAIDRNKTVLPTIDPDSFDDDALKTLMSCFTDNDIEVRLKDFTCGMPVPTIGAIAWDPATFPEKSELVLTAGTATSPVKAAIRALTEVAQLAGDFHTGSCYEPSGMSKPTTMDDIKWLTDGPLVALSTLPSIEERDIREELRQLADGLLEQGYSLYTMDTSRDEIGIPSNYNFVPGFLFRERTPHASVGLFVGRILAEQADFDDAIKGLKVISGAYGKDGESFITFFEALTALRFEDMHLAELKFAHAEPLQQDAHDKALCAFYCAYAMTLREDFADAVPYLDRAIENDPTVKEYFNLRGVCRFKAGEYQIAANDFEKALELDKSSAMDLANLGLCHKFMGNAERAIHFLSAALEHDPSLQFAAEHLAELA